MLTLICQIEMTKREKMKRYLNELDQDEDLNEKYAAKRERKIKKAFNKSERTNNKNQLREYCKHG